MRILCLDVGDKKIGMSLSDPTMSIAQGLKVYRRVSLKEDIKELKKVMDEYDVSELVVGLPKDLNGSIGKRAQGVIDFVDAIKTKTSIPVVLWDERFSTNEAHRVFDMASVRHMKRKPLIDMMAAQIILQGYLDAKRSK
ncbi:MAG TPA: Holliday junction resolvase RuvX [Syntrophorhabdaceae bacterium]|nr:Holliday junction resolvase RuvX [Syntrophorhabdaceae bacterium]HOT42038.1 Holliday junction resolvase RuvX [Syntrophorhabdaceae bacterium]HPC67089.1 Holliday junction resolvase RuvX [Syntrophorhabdaceae bacterium]HQE80125.1 Holliday junction resolvase RuvX [Syntrophorhabdaceae bacterium]HQH43543.1 Holliday junction resolvase RuvX [Syntrophorhabdaceae bacterium]